MHVVVIVIVMSFFVIQFQKMKKQTHIFTLNSKLLRLNTDFFK